MTPHAPRHLARLGRLLLATFFVVGSLLTFPSVLPWMVGAWLLWHTLSVARRRAGWLPLVVGVSILLVKGIDWSPPLLVMAALMLIAATARGLAACSNRLASGGRVAWIAVLALWIAWGAMTLGWYRFSYQSRSLPLLPDRPVVCIGDSLTAYGYPKRLQELISLPVVDLSCDGITAEDGVARLPRLLAANPQVVVIELGGHDFLKGRSRAATKEHLEEIIDACESIGAAVIIMEVPRGFITDPYFGLERQLARERGATLIADTAIRRLVLWSPAAPPGIWLPTDKHLSNDGLHPNARGNELLAEYVTAALTRLYGSEVQRSE